MKIKLNKLQYFIILTPDHVDFINLNKGLIPSDLVAILHNMGYFYNNIQLNICKNLNILLRQFHKNIWISRCKTLHEREHTVSILPAHKKKGNFRINLLNITFPVIRYLDESNNTITPHCEDDLWYNWTIYSCRAEKPWQDF